MFMEELILIVLLALVIASLFYIFSKQAKVKK